MDYAKMMLFANSTTKMPLMSILAPSGTSTQQSQATAATIPTPASTTATDSVSAIAAAPPPAPATPPAAAVAVAVATAGSNPLSKGGHVESLTDPFATYADSFDLSLLPQACESPTVDTNTKIASSTSTSSSSSSSSSNCDNTNNNSNSKSNSNVGNNRNNSNIPITVDQYACCDTPSTPEQPWLPHIKIELSWPVAAGQPNHFQQQEQQQQLQELTKSPSQLVPPPPYPHHYPTPQSSPTQTEFGFVPSLSSSLSSSRSSLYACSPCPSLDATIKQELHALPPSPPESNCETPSPRSWNTEVKVEPLEADVETLMELNSLLDTSPAIAATQSPTATETLSYQLLREYLEDTSFQKRHNLKPLALESFIGDLEKVRGDIEPVISLALEHAKREAEETCAKLHISPDPSVWSTTQVHAWLRSTIAQFDLPPIDDLELQFSENGIALLQLSEEEFMRRAPQVGSTLHAQLEIWKLAYADNYQPGEPTKSQQQHEQQQLVSPLVGTQADLGSNMWLSAGDLHDFHMEDESEDDDDDMLQFASADTVEASTATVVGNTIASTSANVGSGPVPVKRAGGQTGRSGGAHIHLWQFLKELLSAPQLNGTAIRWIDRSKGIFKIEDSVRVAKLWGKRKNRPAMNYDKLSRSIRQYYKKGIMKKTERSQRLVYQFCHPYHL